MGLCIGPAIVYVGKTSGLLRVVLLPLVRFNGVRVALQIQAHYFELSTSETHATMGMATPAPWSS